MDAPDMKLTSLLAGIAVFAAALAVPAVSLAADASTPVREIIDAASHNAASPDEYEDYFSDDRLGRIYSEAFIDVYRAAWKKQEADENNGYLLGADPILNAQDGCALKDLSIETAEPRDGWTPVYARYKAFYCLNTESKDLVTDAQFMVVKQSGGFVIDDIQHIKDGEMTNSLRQTLASLAE